MSGILPVERMTPEELVVRTTDALRTGDLEAGFERNFALSIAKSARRRGWTPSEKQRAAMQRIVRGLRQRSRGSSRLPSLIDWEDTRAMRNGQERHN